MSDELFQSEKKINARNPPNAHQLGILAILWSLITVGNIVMDFYWHHRPLPEERKIFDFLLWPILCIAQIVLYFKATRKERTDDR